MVLLPVATVTSKPNTMPQSIGAMDMVENKNKIPIGGYRYRYEKTSTGAVRVIYQASTEHGAEERRMQAVGDRRGGLSWVQSEMQTGTRDFLWVVDAQLQGGSDSDSDRLSCLTYLLRYQGRVNN